MEKINELFEQEINGVIHAYPSVYSKDDVSELLSKLRTAVLNEASELKPSNTITEDAFQAFSMDVGRNLELAINNGSIDVYDYSSAEFTIDYHNTISIESIDFNSDAVTDELSDILLGQFQDHFGKFIIANPE